DKFREKGYLSVEDESESVSKTLEYSYDMWCVSEIAKELNLTNDEKYFGKFVFGTLELYNNKTGFVQPRKNGNWLQNFNPYEVNNNYTEANGWQYSFYMPHLQLRNTHLLDSLFVANTKTQGREQADITGLIGQYAHGNEPSHNYIYLSKNENRVNNLKKVYDNFYTNKPDGLIGNEDCGQMSAWYVMSALGFYQPCPGDDLLKVGMPLFSKLKLSFSESKSLTIIKKQKKNSVSNYGLIENQSLKKTFKVDEFRFSRILKEDTLKYSNDEAIVNFYPPKIVSDNATKSENVKSSPLISAKSNTLFKDSLEVILKNNINSSDEVSIFYSIDNEKYEKYYLPLIIKKTSTIKAFSIYLVDTSNISTAHFYKRPHNYSIKLNC
ncbi:MAG: glycoside hydrolase domain-containing protein, partial [Chitinophagaceae bacterium]